MPMTVWMRYGEQLSSDVNVVAWDHTDGSALTVQSDIESWEDLGGRTVAVPFWYSIHNVILQLGLRDHNLIPRTDSSKEDVTDEEVNLVVMPPPDMPAALDNGSIAGYIVAEPFNAIGELNAGGKILRFTGDIWRQHACCVVTMKEDLVQQQSEWAANVVSGIVDAQQWLRGNRNQAAQLLSSAETGLYPQGPKPINRALTLYDNHESYVESGAIQHPEWQTERIGFYPYPYPSYTKELVRQMNETRVEGETAFLGELDPESVAEDLVAYNPVETALEQVGGPSAFDIQEDNGYRRDETIQF